jgi:hypothetical protein
MTMTELDLLSLLKTMNTLFRKAQQKLRDAIVGNSDNNNNNNSNNNNNNDASSSSSTSGRRAHSNSAHDGMTVQICYLFIYIIFVFVFCVLNFVAPPVVPIVIRHSAEQQLRFDRWHAFAASPNVKEKKKSKKKKKKIIFFLLYFFSKGVLLRAFLSSCVESTQVDEWAIEQTMYNDSTRLVPHL